MLGLFSRNRGIAMIEVTDLSKRYGDKTVVDALTFTAAPGIVTGFLGPNGAGKSTTMRMIMGLDTPTAGTVRVNGKPYREHSAPMCQIGALLEAKAVHSGRSAHAHLLALAATHGLPRHRVDEVLDIVGLTDVAGKRAGSFSLGMGQRLGIAAALLGDPATVMLDEPVNGLDPEGVLWIRNLLKGLAAEGRTVFVSSHLMAEMAVTADRLVIVGRGRLIADVAITDLTDRATIKSVSVRAAQAARLRGLLAGAGVTITTGVSGELDVIGLTAEQIGARAATAGIVLHELTPIKASAGRRLHGPDPRRRRIPRHRRPPPWPPEPTHPPRQEQDTTMSTHIVSAPTRPVKGGRHRKEPPIVFIEPNKTPETPRTPRVTYPRVLRSEWIKLVSLRSAVITLLASAGVIVGVGLLAAGMSSGTLSAPADGGPPTAADPTGITLTGTNLAQLIIGALGVMLVTSEYTSGLIRLSLAAVPTRLPVLWAKVVVLAVTSFVLLAASVVITFLGAQAMLDAGGSPTAALDRPRRACERWSGPRLPDRHRRPGHRPGHPHPGDRPRDQHPVRRCLPPSRVDQHPAALQLERGHQIPPLQRRRLGDDRRHRPRETGRPHRRRSVRHLRHRRIGRGGPGLAPARRLKAIRIHKSRRRP